MSGTPFNHTIRVLLLIGVLCVLLPSYRCEKSFIENTSFIDSLEQIPDSIQVNKIVIHNLFKSQILAHRNGGYDSLLIIKKVYEPHKQLWDSCYAMIFGEQNASKFNTTKGIVEWNKTLYPNNKKLFDERARSLLALNIDSTLRTNLKKFNRLVEHKPKAIISILFTPLQGIGFGGCNAQQFCLELNYENNSLAYTINKGIPHELNHLVYEPYRVKDPQMSNALGQTIDEGFACYFTWVFFDRKIPQYEAVENMSKENWDWYLAHEKELFQKLKKYFNDKSGDNPLLRNDKLKLFPDALKSLNYWLGFRIIEAYVNKHGQHSWKDIYKMPIAEVYKQSGYEERMTNR